MGKGKEIQFWLILFVLNLLLFFPFAIFSVNHQIFPDTSSIENGNWYSYFKFLFYRPQSDIFRWSLDFFILSSFILYINRFKYLLISIITFLYFSFLGYQFYAGFFELVYFQTPLFYNDLSVLKTGFGIVYQGLNWQFFGSVLLVLLLLLALFFCFRYLHRLGQKIHFSWISKSLLWGLILMAMVNLKYGIQNSSANVFQWQTLQIGQNIQKSWQAKKHISTLNIDSLILDSKQVRGKLEEKPNLYFIAIESYGKVFLEHSELKEHSLSWLKDREEAFRKKGWEMVSIFSESPVTGGLSWIAYSNFSSGFNFKNQGTYDALLNDSSWYEYEDLFSRLQANGYKNYRIMPLYKTGKLVIPWDKYSQFYHVDQWITYEDLNYSGELYGFGPAVPDQYTFNYSREILKKHQGPLSLFFLTVSSHNPFKTPAFADDWQGLNQTMRSHIDGANLMASPTIEDYGKAIQYEWLSIEEFINKNQDDQAIYVVFGDHQPPFICSEKDGFETPMHVFAKNDSLLQEFIKNGFSQGLIPQQSNNFKHEDFLDVFWEAMLKVHGKTH